MDGGRGLSVCSTVVGKVATRDGVGMGRGPRRHALQFRVLEVACLKTMVVLP